MIIYRKNEIADSMFMIHKGKVMLYVENEKSIIYDELQYNILISEIETGDNFGESEVFARCRRITTAKALVDIQLYELSQYDLDSVMFDYPQIRMKKVAEAVKKNQVQLQKIQKYMNKLKNDNEKEPVYG